MVGLNFLSTLSAHFVTKCPISTLRIVVKTYIYCGIKTLKHLKVGMQLSYIEFSTAVLFAWMYVDDAVV